MAFRNEHEPLGGSIFTLTTVICGALGLISAGFIVQRLFMGLESVTNLNNGFPWGIWIAYDVVIGTAFACGGYAMALMTYILNNGRYHPLVRPALLASCFGYTLGGVSIFIDLGRWWNAWHILVPGYMQPNSVMFEVALCVMTYILVLWIEFAPAILTRFRLTHWRKRLDKVLFVFIAIGVLLPTMHQSSLGSLLIVMGQQVHPLWQSMVLPLMFLTTSLAMGFSIVAFEGILGSQGFRKPMNHEIPQLASLARIVAYMLIAYLVIRFGDLAWRGDLALTVTSGWRSLMFWLEIVLFAVPVVLFLRRDNRYTPRWLWVGACCMLLGGAMYRLDAFLVAFRSTTSWNYFPSVPELLVTFGIIALEIGLYIAFVRLFPVFYTHKLSPAELAEHAKNQ